MRFVFKTTYDQDINLAKHEGYFWSYGALIVAALAAPWILDDFFTSELTQVFAFAVCGLGLMIVTGFTGLVSLGHAAFMGIGAYAYGFLLNIGVPFVFALPLGVAITAAVGVLFAIPVLRMTGLYLAIATLAFLIICEQIFTGWKEVTGGTDGMAFDDVDIFGLIIATDTTEFYYFMLVLLVIPILVVANLLRSPLGRAMIAIRDSEISAQSMGINIARTKIIVFGISAAITGLGGIMLAQKTTISAPDSYNVLQSITLLLMIVVGGMGSIHGAVLGAAVVSVLPQAISIVAKLAPQTFQDWHGLEPGVFGLILLIFIVAEPSGLYGMWRKMKLFIDVYPLYRKRTFKRQKAYLKTERMR